VHFTCQINSSIDGAGKRAGITCNNGPFPKDYHFTATPLFSPLKWQRPVTPCSAPYCTTPQSYKNPCHYPKNDYIISVLADGPDSYQQNAVTIGLNQWYLSQTTTDSHSTLQVESFRRL